MPMPPFVITGVAVDGSGVTLLARVLGQGGTPVTRASLSSITYAVSDLYNALPLGSGPIPVTAVLDSLQQSDPRWTADSAYAPGPDGAWGYNFLFTLSYTLFPLTALTQAGVAAPPKRYQADVFMTPASGQPFRLPPFRWTSLKAYG